MQRFNNGRTVDERKKREKEETRESAVLAVRGCGGGAAASLISV